MAKHAYTENPTKVAFKVDKKPREPITRDASMRELKEVAQKSPPKK